MSALFASIPSRRSVVIALIVVAIGSVAVFVATRSSGSANQPGANSKNKNRNSGPLGSALNVDSDAHLFLEGRDSVMVAVDENASNEMVTAISNRDQNAIDSLIESGRALNAVNNTRVRVLQAATGRVKVRILEGPHMMAEGWVLERWLR